MVSDGGPIDALYFRTGKNIVSILGGTNDCLTGGTPAHAWADLLAFSNSRHANGWKTIVLTLPSLGGSGGAADVCRDSINTLIYANWVGVFDRLADLAADTHIGPDGSYSNTTYYAGDGIHLSNLSQQTIVAPLVQTQINALAP